MHTPPASRSERLVHDQSCNEPVRVEVEPLPSRAMPSLKPQSRRRRRQARASRRSRSRRRARTSSAPTTSRAHIHSAPSSRAAPAGLAPAVALPPQPQRSRSQRHHAPHRHSNHRVDGADAKRERVVAAAAAAERAHQARPPRAERTSIALRARVRRRPVSHQPSPCRRSRSDHAPHATTRHTATQTTESTAPTPSASESSQPQPPPSAHIKRAHHEPSAHP